MTVQEQIDSVNEKVDNLDQKIDNLTGLVNKLLQPDDRMIVVRNEEGHIM